MSLFRFSGTLLSAVLAWNASAAEWHEGFVYLSGIDPTIRQDIRYAGPDNFTHAPVPGYQAAECVLTEKAARALAAVQSDIAPSGHGLVVYDCYRPAKAVNYFVQWASKAGPADPDHNPRVPRDHLVKQGYIGSKSDHSAGSTVDLTMTYNGVPIDMGTGFDFFDPLAATNARAVSATARANRRRLVAVMRKHGFNNYSREWWHFTYARQPFPNMMFDFDIVPR
jgi:D-alanyl-D-alanine dipeptidase